VREGEEVPNKGWFSKSKAQLPSTSTQRPPTVPSVGQTQKLGEQGDDDVDLPPRGANASEASTSTLNTSGTGEQSNDVADDIAPELPSHAGFDLAAMRAVVEDINDNQQIQHDMGGLAPLAVPPPLPSHATATTEPQSNSSLITNSSDISPISAHPHIPTGDDDRELTPTSANLPSLSNPWPRGFEPSNEDADEDLLPHPLSLSPSSHATTPTPSTNGDGEASWAPEVPEKDFFGFGTQVANPFRSTSLVPMGPTTALPANTSTASLTASIADRDPWSFPNYSGDRPASANIKKTSVFAANPWDS